MTVLTLDDELSVGVSPDCLGSLCWQERERERVALGTLRHPTFLATPRHFFLDLHSVCLVHQLCFFFEKNEESQLRNEEMFDDVRILDTLRINLGGFARNTWLADTTRQCVCVCVSAACGHYPEHTRRSSCVPKCVLFGIFLLVGFNTQGVPCCLLFFLLCFIVCVTSRCRDCCFAGFSPSQFL